MLILVRVIFTAMYLHSESLRRAKLASLGCEREMRL